MFIRLRDHVYYLNRMVAYLCVFMLMIASHAQDITSQGVVTYGFRNNGKVREGASMQMFCKDGIVSYKSDRQRGRISPETEFLDFNTAQTYQVLTLDDGQKYIFKKLFTEYETAESTGETETILGYECKKAVLKIKSNTIEVWYTDALGLKGSPTISVAPGLGLILKMIRNGSYELFATDIEFRDVRDDELNFNIENDRDVNAETYLRKVIDSRYQTIQVFRQEHINFGDTIVNPADDQAGVTYRYSKGTVLLKKVKLPPLPEGTTVIAEVACWSNGDAYDRTGSLFIIPVQKKISFLDAFRQGIKNIPVYKDKQGKEFQGVVATQDYDPPLELMRFFTPFGVRQFNAYTKIQGYDWADSALYRQDISDLLPRDSSDVWIGVFIGNYAKMGHKASVNLRIHPSFRNRDNEPGNWVKSIFNTTNIMEMSGQEYGTMFHNDSLTVTVDVPEGLEKLYLRYTSTGHGGWGGGDEFNQKLNTIIIDGKPVYTFIPWRDDCATYRYSNPASGNFGNGLTSSDLSRSNWCPGSVTIPEIVPLNDLSPGKHTFKVAIPIGEREGNSFSAWNVSGTLIGTFKE